MRFTTTYDAKYPLPFPSMRCRYEDNDINEQCVLCAWHEGEHLLETGKVGRMYYYDVVGSYEQA